MPEIKDLYCHYSWSYVDNFGKEIHGNGRCTSPLNALTKLCKAAMTPVTEELKERFGINNSVASLTEEIKVIKADAEVLKATVLKALELVSATNETVKQATTPEPPKNKGGRPVVSKSKKAGRQDAS